VLASVAFVVEYAIGGTDAPVGTVFAAMVGVHTLIGIGEGIITTLTVGVVLGVRPDLVYGAADLQTPLVLGPKSGETAGEVR
jgi:cobalt/nickel transport system permease protein